jgi:hypothetical protein
MQKPFNDLRERLLRAGVAPRFIHRYLVELADHLRDLTDEEMRTGLSRNEAESAALGRLGTTDELARAMVEQRHFQSWCVRAPLAVFGVAPLCMLAAAWFVALFILWSGWKMFLPFADTPFGGGPVHGFANLYFQIGRATYFSAPVVVGWTMGMVAARQRLNAIWPVVAFLLVALAGGTLQVQATRAAGGAKHVGMSLASGPFGQVLFADLQHATIFLSLMLLPYLLWRAQRARRVSA